jgi:hypothetical protein
MKRYLLVLGFAVIAALTIAGCLLTAQTTFIEDIDVGYTTDQNFSKYWVDLYLNEDYADHIENVKSVDEVSFVAKIYNQGTLANKAELYISTDSTLNSISAIRANAIRVFNSPTIAAHDSITIRWNDSFRYIENVSDLRNYVMDIGRFEVYGIADTTPFADSIQAQIVVTVTAGN